jgi:hypothetical protein
VKVQVPPSVAHSVHFTLGVVNVTGDVVVVAVGSGVFTVDVTGSTS